MANSSGKRSSLRRLAIMLAVMVAVSFIPMFDGITNAAADKSGKKQSEVKLKNVPSSTVNDVTAAMDKSAEDLTAGDAKKVKSVLGDFKAPATIDSSVKSNNKKFGAAGDNCKVTWSENNTARVTGTVTGAYVFYAIFVDQFDENHLLLGPSSKAMGKKSLNVTVNYSKFEEGFHTFYVIVINPNDTEDMPGFIIKDIPRFLKDRPNYNGSFKVYSKKFNYFPYSSMWTNTSHYLFMEYSANGGKSWKRTGAMKSNMIQLYSEQGFVFKGLAANKKYKTRIRYGEAFSTSTGDSKVIFGPVRNTPSFKTGKAKKPKVKKITVKCINVKRHKVHHPGYWNVVGGYAFWHRPWTEKYYTCKVKITVRLKKKPGTKGILVNGKYLKGNKKVYKYKYSPYPNYFAKRPPKGTKKLLVKVYSYQSKKYGGFSPAYKKKVKAR